MLGVLRPASGHYYHDSWADPESRSLHGRNIRIQDTCWILSNKLCKDLHAGVGPNYGSQNTETLLRGTHYIQSEPEDKDRSQSHGSNGFVSPRVPDADNEKMKGHAETELTLHQTSM